jgi:hypothetical protein
MVYGKVLKGVSWGLWYGVWVWWWVWGGVVVIYVYTIAPQKIVRDLKIDRFPVSQTRTATWIITRVVLYHNHICTYVHAQEWSLTAPPLSHTF